MSLPQSSLRYTVEEYLALERESEERHEYLDGEIYAMAGESPDHGAICTNIGGQLYAQLRGTPCQVFSKDMKVRSGPEPNPLRPPRGLYSYPDLLVVCGEMKFHDEHRDVLLNPTVIIEVLSPTTEVFDRGEKWLRYQTWLPSLTDYLLVSQSKPMIEHYLRQPDGAWLYSLVNGLEGSVSLVSIGCTLWLADVYDRIGFPAEPPESTDWP
ncbi:MAG: Uma2 family endonuclease [Acidobacteria bacterium]|nr:Uma2 family endonuclease [Acidobacteriota bacterium]